MLVCEEQGRETEGLNLIIEENESIVVYGFSDCRIVVRENI